MSFQAQLVMVLCVPIVFYLFKRFSVAQAIVTAFLVAWLFLPQKAGFSFSGLPDYERISATCYGIVLCLLIFGSQQKTIWKFNWIDIPIVIYCICPFFSSLSNGLGAYDGASATLGNIVQYGLPYFIGRIYLANTQGLSILTKSILISGLVYVPLCLYEVRMSPQLHRIVYGYHGIRQFAQGIRYGGFRPSVFMRHGLSVGMWMMAVTLIALWLWQSGVVKKIPISIIIFILLVTVILVKSTGAYAYLLYGLIVLFTAKLLRFSFPLVILCLSIWLYQLLQS